MSNDKPQYAHATSPDGRWEPVDVESPSKAAHHAARMRAHEATGDELIVLVGQTEWLGPDNIASFLHTETFVEHLDELLYDELGDIPPRLLGVAEGSDMQALDDALSAVLAGWLQGIDYPELFRVPEWHEWRVTRWPEEAGGPQVERVYDDDEIPF